MLLRGDVRFRLHVASSAYEKEEVDGLLKTQSGLMSSHHNWKISAL